MASDAGAHRFADAVAKVTRQQKLRLNAVATPAAFNTIALVLTACVPVRSDTHRDQFVVVVVVTVVVVVHKPSCSKKRG